MVNLINEGWVVDLGARKCTDIKLKYVVKITFKDCCVRGKLMKIPKGFYKLKCTEKEKELYLQLKILEAEKVFYDALRESFQEYEEITV
ncbi:MAG: hypothetical protein LBH43_12355 [Treponema sp.]|jgi:hypothetical protein|nr:hypothetical protein [Treponema sp.]